MPSYEDATGDLACPGELLSCDVLYLIVWGGNEPCILGLRINGKGKKNESYFEKKIICGYKSETNSGMKMGILYLLQPFCFFIIHSVSIRMNFLNYENISRPNKRLKAYQILYDSNKILKV